jgi:protein-S-isoprenylcysteine O-methyltransferase Ste14
MKRVLIFTYGVICYALSVATLIYTAAFLINFGVPKSIDSAREVPFMTALAVNLALLAVFSVQHSVMARPSFKRWWTGIVPESAERSTYMLFSSAALGVLFAFWQPIGIVVWNVDAPVARATLYGIFAFGWMVLLFATFLINHFDLFGLRQVWLQLLGRPYRPLSFQVTALYRYVRHPIYLGYADDDCSSSGFCRRHQHLYSHRDLVRGAQPGRGASRIRRLSPPGANAAAVDEAARPNRRTSGGALMTEPRTVSCIAWARGIATPPGAHKGVCIPRGTRR